MKQKTQNVTWLEVPLVDADLVSDVGAILQLRNQLSLHIIRVQLAVADEDVILLGRQIRDEDEPETRVRVEPDGQRLLVVEAEDDDEKDNHDKDDSREQVRHQDGGAGCAELVEADRQNRPNVPIAVDGDVVRIL